MMRTTDGAPAIAPSRFVQFDPGETRHFDISQNAHTPEVLGRSEESRGETAFEGIVVKRLL
jgi:hypothetical protein